MRGPEYPGGLGDDHGRKMRLLKEIGDAFLGVKKSEKSKQSADNNSGKDTSPPLAQYVRLRDEQQPGGEPEIDTIELGKERDEIDGKFARGVTYGPKGQLMK